MLLYWDLNNGDISLNLFDRAHLSTSLPLSAGVDEDIFIQTHRNGIPELLPVGTTFLFGVKPLTQFEGAYLCSTAVFSRPADDSGFYTGLLLTDTGAIRTALFLDSNATNDVLSIPLTITQIDYWLPGATYPQKSRVFSVTINNFVNQGGETEPGASTPYPSPSTILTTALIATSLSDPDATKVPNVGAVNAGLAGISINQIGGVVGYDAYQAAFGAANGIAPLNGAGYIPIQYYASGISGGDLLSNPAAGGADIISGGTLA